MADKKIHETLTQEDFRKGQAKIYSMVDIVVDEDGEEHWLARGPLSKPGYKKGIRFGGKPRRGHIVAYLAYNCCSDTGGLLVRHKCKHKHCLNPAHLELGTHSDNARDRIRDGTQYTGKGTIKRIE